MIGVASRNANRAASLSQRPTSEAAAHRRARAREAGISASACARRLATYRERTWRSNVTLVVALHLGDARRRQSPYVWSAAAARREQRAFSSASRDPPRDRAPTRSGSPSASPIAAVAGGDPAASGRARPRNPAEPWQICDRAAFVRDPALVIADAEPEEVTLDDLGIKRAIRWASRRCLALRPGVSRSGITITTGRGVAPEPRRERTLRSCC